MLDRSCGVHWLAPLFVAALLAITGCADRAQTEPLARAPVLASAETANPQEAAPVAPAFSSTVTEQEPSEQGVTTSQSAATMGESPLPTPLPALGSNIGLPGVIARIPLADDSNWILDFRRDEATGRDFVATTDGRLVVLDDATFESIFEFPFGGELTLDEEGRRLYVGPGRQYVPPGEAISVRVINVDELDVVGELPDVHAVSVDREHNRLFAGSPARPAEDDRSAPTIRVYNLETLELITELPHQGIPTYNPFRDELIVTGYSALVVNPDTGEALQDLLPELAEQPFPWCNGCEHATAAYVVEPAGPLIVELEKVSTGGGPGISPSDRYFEASTLEEVMAFGDRFAFQPACSTLHIPVPPVSGRLFWQQYFVRTVVYRNFEVHEMDGELAAWRDGLFASFIDDESGLAYTAQGYVIDLESLTPVARLPEFCLLDVDSSGGRVFGRIDGDLLVLSMSGGFEVTAPPTEPEPLPAGSIDQIVASPAYPDDPTVFVLMEDARLYRTTDAGQTWLRIQGGLPAHDDLELTIALSPDFAIDRTLFAGGYVGTAHGEGVLRSTDAGVTWQPLWDGLTHLRVYDVRPSSGYAEDGTVRALARYNRLSPWEEGVSLHESVDAGLTWTLVMTATNESELDRQMAALEGALTGDASTPLRIVESGAGIEVLNGGGAWSEAELELKPGETVLAAIPSPNSELDDTYYALGDFSVWRTTDAGESWARWRDPRLAGRTFDNALTAMTATPLAPDGSYQLLVGTRAGEFWILSPTEPAQPVTMPTPTQAATENGQDGSGDTETITATVVPTRALTDTYGLDSPPPDGRFRPGGALADVWEASPETRSELGWALTELASPVPAAYQIFERGVMLWEGGSGAIFALYEDGTWQRFEDTFEEGDAESDPSLTPPGGGFQPIRGFGKVWRSEPDVRDSLGWALDEERGYSAYVHEFERGALFGTPTGTRILVREDEGNGTWR